MSLEQVPEKGLFNSEKTLLATLPDGFSIMREEPGFHVLCYGREKVIGFLAISISVGIMKRKAEQFLVRKSL